MRNVITFSLHSISEKSVCICSAQESRVDMVGTTSPASVTPRHPPLGQGLEQVHRIIVWLGLEETLKII